MKPDQKAMSIVTVGEIANIHGLNGFKLSNTNGYVVEPHHDTYTKKGS